MESPRKEPTALNIFRIVLPTNLRTGTGAGKLGLNLPASLHYYALWTTISNVRDIQGSEEPLYPWLLTLIASPWFEPADGKAESRI
ncbi:MAG: hypothetical protein U0930_10500 [Pirellulales bacterium]